MQLQQLHSDKNIAHYLINEHINNIIGVFFLTFHDSPSMLITGIYPKEHTHYL